MNRSLPLLLSCALLLAGGCIVDSSYGQCAGDSDCPGGEICKLSTGQCYLQCQSDSDCYVGGKPAGKTCQANRCVFSISDRVPAPAFCLKVANPKSAHYNKDLCLSQLKGKVVMLYFGLLG